MKVIGINGSPHCNGNTAQGIKLAFNELENEGFETEFIQLGGKKIFGCLACKKCAVSKDAKCSRQDDEINEIIEKMISADGIIIGSPTFFSNVTSEVKALIDRSCCVSKVNGGLFRNKVGASVVTSRRAGANFTYSAINFFFGASEMIIPCSDYWNMSLCTAIGDIEKDDEGIRTLKTLGKNMARILIKLNS